MCALNQHVHGHNRKSSGVSAALNQHVHSLLRYVYAFSFRLALYSCCYSAMAFVGPVRWPQGYRPVGVYCDVCDTNLLTWRCYSCGGLYCGRCIFMHSPVPGVTFARYDAGLEDANEVAEGMHCLWFRGFERLRSLMACDPAAAANDWFSRGFICR